MNTLGMMGLFYLVGAFGTWDLMWISSIPDADPGLRTILGIVGLFCFYAGIYADLEEK